MKIFINRFLLIVVFSLWGILFQFGFENKVYSQKESIIRITQDISIFKIPFGSDRRNVINELTRRNAKQLESADPDRDRFAGINMARIPTKNFYTLFDHDGLMYGAVAVIEETSNYNICDKKFSAFSKILFKKYNTPTKSKNSYFLFKGVKLIEKTRVWYFVNIANQKKFIISLVLRPYNDFDTTKDWLGALSDISEESENNESTTLVDESNVNKIRVELSYQDVTLYNKYNTWRDNKLIEDF